MIELKSSLEEERESGAALIPTSVPKLEDAQGVTPKVEENLDVEDPDDYYANYRRAFYGCL